MNGTPFKLGTFAKQGGKPFAAIVLGDDVIELAAVHRRPRCAKVMLNSAASIDGLLENWDANFAVLQEIVAFLEKEGRPGAAKLASLRALPPVAPARQDVLRRAEFSGACRRDAARRHDAGDRPEIHRRKVDVGALSLPESAEYAGRRL